MGRDRRGGNFGGGGRWKSFGGGREGFGVNLGVGFDLAMGKELFDPQIHLLESTAKPHWKYNKGKQKG